MYSSCAHIPPLKVEWYVSAFKLCDPFDSRNSPTGSLNPGGEPDDRCALLRSAARNRQPQIKRGGTGIRRSSKGGEEAALAYRSMKIHDALLLKADPQPDALRNCGHDGPCHIPCLISSLPTSYFHPRTIKDACGLRSLRFHTCKCTTVLEEVGRVWDEPWDTTRVKDKQSR